MCNTKSGFGTLASSLFKGRTRKDSWNSVFKDAGASSTESLRTARRPVGPKLRDYFIWCISCGCRLHNRGQVVRVPETRLLCALCLQKAQWSHATVEAPCPAGPFGPLLWSPAAFQFFAALMLSAIHRRCRHGARQHLLKDWSERSACLVELLAQSTWWECAWRCRTGSSLCKCADDVQVGSLRTFVNPSPHSPPRGVAAEKYYLWFLHTFLLIIWFSRWTHWITVFFCRSPQAKLS